MGYSKRDVTSRLIHRIDASSGCGHGAPRDINGLLEGIESKGPSYALDRAGREATSRSVEGGRQLRRPQV
jgi:hypothetical protein